MEKRILFLADIGNPHMIKWIRATAQDYPCVIKGIGLSPYDEKIYADLENVSFYSFNLSAQFTKSGIGKLKKIKYLFLLNQIKKMVKEFKPDLIHVHYASSYALLARLINFHPTVLNIWGADIFDFPQRSWLHKKIIQGNLAFADYLNSTSHVMARESNKYTNKKITITPFGVDTELFKPVVKTESQEFVFGTIKTLEEKYGIEYLICAFALLLKHEVPHKKLKLLIVGKGQLENFLKNLCVELGIEKRVEFTGFISPNLVPSMHQKLQVAVYPSILDSESFGVSVVESMSCGIPVIVSNKGGLTEVILSEETGLIFESQNIQSLYDKMKKLYLEDEYRGQLSKRARQHVLSEYDFQQNKKIIFQQYDQIFQRDQ